MNISPTWHFNRLPTSISHYWQSIPESILQ